MSFEDPRYQFQEHTMADRAPAQDRAQFIVRTYTHLFGAIAALCVIELGLMMTPLPDAMMQMLAGSQYSWLLVLGAFMGVSWIANSWAQSETSLATQYLGLGVYVVAQALILLPVLYMAANYGGASVIPTAGIATACIFTGLTVTVFITRANFNFLGPFLGIAGMAAMGFIVVSILFGFSLGNLFTVAMIGFAGAFILYDTSKVMREYRTTQYVAAALALFASVALLFWYILQFFMGRD